MFQKFLKSFYYAFRGLKYLWQEEQNFRIQIVIGLAVILAAVYFKFSYLELSLLLFLISAVLSAEALNTVLEDVLTKIQPNFDPQVGKIKDMTAGIVLIISTISLVIGLIIIWHNFF